MRSNQSRQRYKVPTLRAIWLFFIFLNTPLLWGQHGGHTHGKAELNLVIDADRELVVELITPAESVYGFEHAPRNAEETEQMEQGLKRLKASLVRMLAFDKKMACSLTEIDGESYDASIENDTKKATHTAGKKKHNHSHHSDHAKKDHAHHDHNHNGKSHTSHEEDKHRNVIVRWKIRCGTELMGQNVSVNWNDILADIHHMEVTILTSDRQDAISLKRSGNKVRL